MASSLVAEQQRVGLAAWSVGHGGAGSPGVSGEEVDERCGYGGRVVDEWPVAAAFEHVDLGVWERVALARREGGGR